MNRQNKLLITEAEKAVKKNEERRAQDPHLLQYHITPPTGLLNDPNGFIHYQGTYHLFYQWNPFATAHGSKFWAHMTSKDLVHWQRAPVALAPSEPFDQDGCYSGSAIEQDGTLYLFYTGNVKEENGQRQTYQCLATSKDGDHFNKIGPVIQLPDGFTAHFRDPKVWKERDQFYMVIGAQDEQERGCVVLFTSTNLYDWSYSGIIAGAWRQNLHDFGYMWECPDLFRLNGKDVLLACPQGLKANGMTYLNIFQSGYFIGKLDMDKAQYHHGAFEELDRGFDFYAPQTTLDAKGRRLLFGWMGITDESEAYQPTIEYGWIHAMTLPRELILKDNRLYQQPVEELKKLRTGQQISLDAELHDAIRSFAQVSGKTIEILLTDIHTEELETFGIDISDQLKIVYNTEKQVFILQRRNLASGKLEERAAPIGNLKNIRIYLDTSSIEIFLNDGADVFSARFFPDPDDDKLIFRAKGNIRFRLQKWDLGRME